MMMKMMEEGVIRDVFKSYNRYPVPVSAFITTEKGIGSDTKNQNLTISTEWSQCDVDRGVRLRFSQHWNLQCNEYTLEKFVCLGPSIHTHGELLSSRSPFGLRRAVIRDGVGHQYLEVWGCGGLEKSLDLTALNKHGKVYEDGTEAFFCTTLPLFYCFAGVINLGCWFYGVIYLYVFVYLAHFACLVWSPCEGRLLYIAEKRREGSSANDSGSLSVLEEEDKNAYVEDWGEGLVGKSAPVLCVANLTKGEVNICPGVPRHVSPGQALWTGDGKAVIFVGWWHEPFRLGLKFCSNRRSAVFSIDLKGNSELLSCDSGSVMSPRLSPDSLWLVYLQGQVFGPHQQCLRMMLYDMKNRTTSVLVDVVRRAEKGQFTGVYEPLALHCWSSDSERIFFSSACENNKMLYSVERRTGTVTPVQDTAWNEFGSVKLLAVIKDLMVMSCSAPNHPPSLKVGFVPDGKHVQSVQWSHLGGANTYENFDWESMIITPTPEEENHQFSGISFGAMLLKPARSFKAVKFPLVVFIHGGPHSHFAAEWNVTAAALTKLGFAVLMVNYRGSTGFGQDAIDSLLGNIGGQDVKDVQRAVLHVLQSNKTLDPDRVAVMGGSHGGFLACHLIGQYPEFYRACAARNPVINAATLLGTSDIIDWRYSSVGLEYSFDQLPTSQALTTMLDKSPIVHAAQIRTPVLLMLGGKDKRVSPYQGLELYKALKSRNSPVRLLWYDSEGHSLSKVETQSDCFLNVALWFKQHLNMN
ncbi:S9 family peptidase isoform X1 [Ictalurus furcatus]|uniref:S9 family peptidase isoform X1 n=1 Tax=Ictalurus furcatus TaxID=66913 RepID=UPI0023501F62|nr:S9 family peptidase isoform X1 [Ictalurus furcatus]XP_053481386.1 S9 family peptidase isoform X1 [Ictalurus furcatus]